MTQKKDSWISEVLASPRVTLGEPTAGTLRRFEKFLSGSASERALTSNELNEEARALATESRMKDDPEVVDET